MPYGTPTDPVAGTVITVAYAVANLLDPIRWLRQLTGNADPPAANYVVVSTSTTGSNWAKITNDQLAAGVAVANLGYTPVNKAGDTLTGLLVSALSGIRFQGAGHPGGENWTGFVPAGTPTSLALQNATSTNYLELRRDGELLKNGLYRFWHENNDGAGSGLDADLLDGLSSNQFARLAAGSDFAAGFAPTYNGGNVFWRQDNDGTGSGLDADLLDGEHRTSVSPNGSILAFASSADLTAAGASWAACDGLSGTPDLRGRLLVGAGASFSQTFTAGTNYGSDWTPTSPLAINNTLAFVASNSGNTGGIVSDGSAQIYGTTVSGTSAHHHTFGGSLSGGVSLTGAGGAWIPPSGAVVWGKRITT